MKCIQAFWPKHIPKGKHYQIIVFSELIVDEPQSGNYWGRNPEPTHTKHYIQKIYATSIKEDWEADIKELMHEDPKRTDMIALVVEDVALIESETKVTMRNKNGN